MLEVSSKLNVNFNIKGQTFLNMIQCEPKQVESLYFIINEQKSKPKGVQYNFDTEIINTQEDSFDSILQQYILLDKSTIKQTIHDNDFEKFEEYFSLIIDKKRLLIPEDFQL